MSGFGDSLEFEKFQLGDWWDKIKDNPEQLILGAGDPISAGLWGSILDKEYEPFVNVLGGPYGGSGKWSSGLGEGGGVYERARDAGIDTSSAAGIHDIAEVVAGTMAGYYGGQAAGLWGGQTPGINPGAESSVQTFPYPESGPIGGGEYIDAAGNPIGGGMGDLGSLMSEYSDLLNKYGGMGSGQGMGSAGQASDPPPQRTIQPGSSSFVPMDVGAPQVYSPRRMTPFGLLTDEEEERMRTMFGGIL